MPWLVREDDMGAETFESGDDSDAEPIGVDDPKKALLFVHVPRCGGTSLNRKHEVVRSARREASRKCRRCGCSNLFIGFYAYRYELLESANFPLITYENLWGILWFVTSVSLIMSLRGYGFFHADLLIDRPCVEIYPCRVMGKFPWIMLSHSVMIMFSSTFIFVAYGMRYKPLRRFTLCAGSMLGLGSAEWLYGADTDGLYQHMPAPRMLQLGIVAPEEMKRVSSFAIVRNPFSRMVSIYSYNKMGCVEGFGPFARRWCEWLRKWEAKNLAAGNPPPNEWEIWCHILPIHYFTHDDFGKNKLVNYIVKQEELKLLKDDQMGLSDPLYYSLTHMPHLNSRKRKKPWKEFYTPEIEAIVLEAYKRDFEVFGYKQSIHGDNPPDGYYSNGVNKGGYGTAAQISRDQSFDDTLSVSINPSASINSNLLAKSQSAV